MAIANIIAFIILLIGAINWGLIGIFRWNLVEKATMGFNIYARVIYILVLLAAIWLIISAIIGGGALPLI